MTEKQFLNIADTYESFDRNYQSYVPAKNINELVEVVFETNKHDYNESLADLGLFNFKVDSSRAKNYLKEIPKNYLQNK